MSSRMLRRQTLSLIDRFLLLIVSVFFLSACGDNAGPTTIDPRILSSIVAWFAVKYSWKFATNAADRHKGFFIRRRAQFLTKQDENWLKGSDYQPLKTRLGIELTTIDDYLAHKIGTIKDRGAFYGGKSDSNTPHLDIADIAERHTRDMKATTVAEAIASNAPNEVQRQVLELLEWRKTRVISIVWRAAALHDELWNVSQDGKTVHLREVAMNDILDRRLRAVELMYFQISTAGSNPGLGNRESSGYWTSIERIDTGWHDGAQGSFEYPALSAKPDVYDRAVTSDRDAVRQYFGNPDIVERSKPRFDTNFRAGSGKPPWHYNAMEQEYETNEAPPGVRLPSRNRGWWSLGKSDLQEREEGTYALLVKKLDGWPTPATIVQDLLDRSYSDWWQRCWLYDDHVMSAIHLEALRFALLRRTGSDDIFNSLIDKYALALNDHFNSRPVDWVIDDPEWATESVIERDLMRSTSEYFENRFLPNAEIADLEVGDHLLFWNHFLYGVIRTGMPHLTHVLVTDVSSEPNTGGIHVKELMLQAFKTKELTCPAYQLHMQKEIQRVWKNLQDYVIAEAIKNQSVSKLKWDSWHTTWRHLTFSINDIIWRWEPYKDDLYHRYKQDPDEFVPAAFWIRINLERWGRAIGITDLSSPDAAKQAVVAIPKSVAWTSKTELITADLKKRDGSIKRLATGSGFVPPPWKTGIVSSEEPVPRNQSLTIFFPIFEPSFIGGWTTYFEKKATSSQQVGLFMERVKVDGDVVPVFFNSFNRTASFRVLRPQIAKR